MGRLMDEDGSVALAAPFGARVLWEKTEGHLTVRGWIVDRTGIVGLTCVGRQDHTPGDEEADSQAALSLAVLIRGFRFLEEQCAGGAVADCSRLASLSPGGRSCLEACGLRLRSMGFEAAIVLSPELKAAGVHDPLGGWWQEPNAHYAIAFAYINHGQAA